LNEGEGSKSGKKRKLPENSNGVQKKQKVKLEKKNKPETDKIQLSIVKQAKKKARMIKNGLQLAPTAKKKKVPKAVLPSSSNYDVSKKQKKNSKGGGKRSGGFHSKKRFKRH